MNGSFKSSRDIIIRTEKWPEAISFYESVLGLPIVYRDATMIGFESGAFRLYVEKGDAHGAVFEFLVSDVEEAKRKLLEKGCQVVEEIASLPRCYVKDPFGLVFNVGPG